jgi:hypothetical protein
LPQVAQRCMVNGSEVIVHTDRLLRKANTPLPIAELKLGFCFDRGYRPSFSW